MQNFLKRLTILILGVIAAFALYIVPDMAANLGESNSLLVKAIAATLLFVFGIIALKKKRPSAATLLLSASVALLALLAFGNTIRLSELGVL